MNIRLRKKRFSNRSKKSLNLYWWYGRNPEFHNFGDEITKTLVEDVFGLDVKWSPPSDCQLAGSGSIIEILLDEAKDNNLYVWGSGFIQPGAKLKSNNLRFLATRGTISRDRVDNPNLTIGDPGLLMPIAHPIKGIKRFSIGIIPNHVESNLPVVKELDQRADVSVINPLLPPKLVANQINQCEVIFSSSLHGVILSDAYNVPNMWLPLSDRLKGGDYKFKDYYSCFDIKPPKADLNTISTWQDVVSNYKPKTNIKEIQNNLIKVFPY